MGVEGSLSLCWAFGGGGSARARARTRGSTAFTGFRGEYYGLLESFRDGRSSHRLTLMDCGVLERSVSLRIELITLNLERHGLGASKISGRILGAVRRRIRWS